VVIDVVLVNCKCKRESYLASYAYKFTSKYVDTNPVSIIFKIHANWIGYFVLCALKAYVLDTMKSMWHYDSLIGPERQRRINKSSTASRTLQFIFTNWICNNVSSAGVAMQCKLRKYCRVLQRSSALPIIHLTHNYCLELPKAGHLPNSQPIACKNPSKTGIFSHLCSPLTPRVNILVQKT
jgi:hypothetical protein